MGARNCVQWPKNLSTTATPGLRNITNMNRFGGLSDRNRACFGRSHHGNYRAGLAAGFAGVFGLGFMALGLLAPHVLHLAGH